MIKRIVEKNVLNSLQQFPVVGIIGSRQVGKTTLAKQVQTDFTDSVYLDLELPSDLNKLRDPELFLVQNADKLIIIDEIQRLPELFPILRSMVDQNRKPGRFLILGSSSPDLIRNSSESLAGRIYYHELSPFLFKEIEQKDNALDRLHFRGGYPDSYLAINPKNSAKWRESFIRTFLERDIPQLGIRIPSIQLRRFWTMLAHNHGKFWNASEIARSLDVSPPTAKYYLDILTDTFVVRQLPPFFVNIKKRLKKSPKVYLRDSGILHSLLNINSQNELHGHPIAGFSWEGFCIEQTLNTAADKYQGFFYKSNGGSEIDLVLQRGSENLVAVEFKYSLSPKPTKGFWNAFNDLKCKKGFVVYPGKDSYYINDTVQVTPLTKVLDLI